MDTKKISFGFNKINKRLNLLPNKVHKEESKVELIKCVEAQVIKLVKEKPEEAPLIIPLKQQGKTSAALASLIRRRAVLLGEDDPEPEVVQPEPVSTNAATNGGVIAAAPAPPETLDARAARELLAELHSSNGEALESPNLVLPVVHADELPLDGAKQSTLHDYESVPVQQYGLAMLRGMGWVEPPKKKTAGGGAAPVEEAPFVRPKGMGLGADKALKKQPLLVAPEANEVLEIKKQAFVRILGGKHKELYGQIEGFDDFGARVIVKMAIGGAKEAFNEFLCQAVSRKEFAQYGKCINSAKYEEFKKMENEHGQIIIKDDNEEKPQIKKETSEQRYDDKISEKKEQKSDDEKLKDSKRKIEKYETDRKPKEEYALNNQEKEEKSHIKRESSVDKKYEKSKSKVEDDSRKDSRNYEKEHKSRDESARKYDDERKKASASTSSSRRRYEDNHQPQSSKEAARNQRDVADEERSEKRRSRSAERRDHQKPAASSSSSRRRRSSGSAKSSADSESDSDDSDYRRKHRKKSSHKSKSKKHAKKSKSKSKRRSDNSDADDSDEPSSSRSKGHKKKTKKSKKPRSRSRSPRARR